MMPDSRSTSQPIEIFYSYAREDRQLRERLQNHLKILQRQGLIAQWTDQLITAGRDYNKEIHENLDSASIVLFLVSEYFLASDYCYGVEVARAFERASAGEARVIPVILRDCPWKDDERLAGLNVLPGGARPVTRWKDRASAFADVAAGIKAVVQELAPKRAYGVSPSKPLAANELSAIESLPRLWNVPHSRDPGFIDREGELTELSERLDRDRGGHGVAVLVGPPGIGKTHLATEFAYRRQSHYQVVWWVRAQHNATLGGDVRALAWALGLDPSSPGEGDSWDVLSGWLKKSSGYLLIFDDATNVRAFLRSLPHDTRGHVIVTAATPSRGMAAVSMRLGPVDLPTSIQFLTGQFDSVDTKAVHRLAKHLRGMPFALSLASQYLAHSRETVGEFLDDLQEGARVHRTGGRGPDASLSLVLDQVEAASPPGRDFLRLVSMFASDDIPLEELSAHRQTIGEPLATTLGEASGLDDLLALLAELGLATRAGDALSVPRHVQTLLRMDMSAEDRSRWSLKAVLFLEAAFPAEASDVRTWRSCARLLPHSLTAIDHAELDSQASIAAGRILRRISAYLLGRAQLDDALAAAQRAVQIHERHFGVGHSEVASDLAALGRVYQAMDDLRSARGCFERAVAINEQTFGTDHPKIARDLIHLGRFLRRIRDLDGARATLQRAIRLARRSKEPNRRDLSSGLSHLGRVLQDLGQLGRARTVLCSALAIDEADLGPTHPAVATELINVARVLREMKELDDAKAYLERSLKILQKEYGGDHYEVAIALANLGRVAQDLGDPGSAEGHLAQAVDIFQASLGPEHSFTTTAKDWLDSVRRQHAPAH